MGCRVTWLSAQSSRPSSQRPMITLTTTAQRLCTTVHRTHMSHDACRSCCHDMSCQGLRGAPPCMPQCMHAGTAPHHTLLMRVPEILPAVQLHLTPCPCFRLTRQTLHLMRHRCSSKFVAHDSNPLLAVHTHPKFARTSPVGAKIHREGEPCML